MSEKTILTKEIATAEYMAGYRDVRYFMTYGSKRVFLTAKK